MKSWVWCAGYFSPQDTWKWVHTININKKCIHVSPSWVSPKVWILNFRKQRSAFLLHFSPSLLLARLWIQRGLACGWILLAAGVCQLGSHLFPHVFVFLGCVVHAHPIVVWLCSGPSPLLIEKGRLLRAGSLNHLSSSAPNVQYTFVELRQDNLELRQSLSHQKPPGRRRGLFLLPIWNVLNVCVCVCFEITEEDN